MHSLLRAPIGATMTGDDADAYKEAIFEVGMIPYAFEDGIDTILQTPHPGGQYTKMVM